MVDRLVKSIFINDDLKSEYEYRGKTLNQADVVGLYNRDKGLFLEKFGRYLTKADLLTFQSYSGTLSASICVH